MRSMDQDFTSEEKKKIYDELFDTFFVDLKSGKLDVEEGRIISGYILDNCESIIKKKDFLNFLEKLCQKWSLFNGYLLRKKEELAQTGDKEKIKEITDKLHSFVN